MSSPPTRFMPTTRPCRCWPPALERPACATPHHRARQLTAGYAGFNGLFETGRIAEAGCWAHARRKFFDVRAANSSPIENGFQVHGIDSEDHPVLCRRVFAVPEPGVWTGIASANAEPLRWKRAQTHRGSRHRNSRISEAGYTSAVVATDPEPAETRCNRAGSIYVHT
jgi:hypothetical protein